MNILTTNGLVGRYVTDWSGPGGVLRDVGIRLGAPNYPDDTMTLTGSVTAKSGPEADGRRGLVEVTLRGANGLGDHVTGTVDGGPAAGRGGRVNREPRLLRRAGGGRRGSGPRNSPRTSGRSELHLATEAVDAALATRGSPRQRSKAW